MYDAENRLVSTSGAKTATLTYDPMGRLYQVADGAGAQRFLYDGDRLILEYNSSGVVQRRYAHGAGVDEPMVWYEGDAVSSATRRYLHADHQGSIVNVTNAAGSTLLVGVYDAYGVTTSRTRAIPVHGSGRDHAGRAVLLQGAVLQPGPRKIHADGPDWIRR